LNGLERDYRMVIYEASSESPAWARRCARQADRVLAVAMGDGIPQDSRIEPSFFDAISERGSASVDLVLLHTDGTLRPQSTAAWLALFPFGAHHHVRLTSPADFARLGRRLAGRAVGVVLGGGAARAYGHIGVLRALEESGVPIDYLGGTSAGALIAAQYAYGYSCDEIIELNRRGLASRLLLKELTIPLVALLNSKQVKRSLALSFGDAGIENLWLPFFCVSTNLTRAELTVHRDGSIARWVRASLSIPGVLPPVLSPTGDLLVDGAVLNNVPVDVMRSHVNGPTIGVDVSPTERLVFGHTHRETIPSWRHLLRDLGQLETSRPPTLLSILHRTMLLASETQRVRARSQADLYLCPPLDRFDMFDWRALDQIVAAAHEHALREVEKWWSSRTVERQ
jgi:predicted acylesterase/phospholipase RssA